MAHTVIRFENAGTGERTSSFRIRLQDDSAVEKFSQLVFPYNSLNETVEIRRVLVHKRDGTTAATSTDAVKDGPPAPKDAPAYPAEKEKVVAVAGLSVGDTLDYELVTRLVTPFAPNEFWAEYKFIRDAVVLDEELDLNLPHERSFSVKGPGVCILQGKIQSNAPAAKGVSFSRSDDAGRTILRWRHANPTPSSDVDQQRSTQDALKSPDIQLTTFTSWQEVARWELALWKDSAQANAAVTAKAAEITQGLTTEDEKVRALYEFVSKNIRVVNSEFGSKHFAPRNAAEILASSYGDSADEYVLLAAMLNAARIPSGAGLMPATGKLDATVPSPAQLEHILTVVPHGATTTWLDPSAQVAPFDFLAAPLRGESALLLAPGSTPKIVRTPVDPPFAPSQTVEIEATVSDLGKLSGTIHYSVRGDTEFVLRTAFHRTPQSQWKDLAQTVLKLDGLHGDVGALKASDPQDTEKPFELQIEFSEQGFLDWSTEKTRVSLPLLTIGMPDAPAQGNSPIELGTPLKVVTHLHLKFPSQLSAEGPIGTDVKRDYAEFSSAYRFENGALTADRSLNFKLRQIPAGRASDYRSFTAAVNADEAQSLAVNNNQSQPGAIPADASANDIFDAATAAMTSGNVSAAIPLFVRVTEVDPTHAHAWNDLGLAYLRAGKPEDAVAAFRKQLELSPSDEHANNYLGVALEQEHQYDEAAAAFRKQIALNPLDTVAHGALGTILLEQHDDAAAVIELEKATILSPQSATLEVSLGRAYLESGSNQKGIDALRKAVDLSPTATVFNTAAYNLAEHNLDLDHALEYANQAVKAGSEKLTNVTLARASQTDITRSHDLAAFWDTLGWVYFRKGDFANAERYVTSASLVSHRSMTFDHLARIYAKRGEKDRAIRTYALALSMPDADPETRARLTLLLGGNSQVDALVANARADFVKTPQFSLKAESTETGSADFLILLSSRRSETGTLAHVEDVKFVTGSESFRPFAIPLRSLNYGSMFPALSPAKLELQGKLTCSPPDECSFTLSPEVAALPN